MQYYNIYNNMMAYGAMNHCLLFGKMEENLDFS